MVSLIPRWRPGRVVALGLCLFGELGCAASAVQPAFRGQILVTDRGISVPLPPPSLDRFPLVDVTVTGRVQPDDGHVLADAEIVVVDTVGASEARARIDGDTFTISDFRIDITRNCLEFWVEGAGVGATEVFRYHAVLVEDDRIEAVAGCTVE